MGKYRRDRINEEMAHEIGLIVRDVKDPRVSGYMISVLRAEVTADLKYAKVYYSVLGGNMEEADKKELRQGLKSAAPFIRGQIAQRMNLRITPELSFAYDESIAYGAKINEILHSDSVRADLARFEERLEKEAAEAAANAENTSEDEFDD